MRTSHQLNVSWSRAVSLAFALLCFAGSAPSAPSAPAASSHAHSWPAAAPQIASQFAIADFDGDRRPDLATVQAGQIGSLDTQYWIAFQLSSGPRQTLGITAPTGGLQITSRDVNGDDFLDIIVTTAWTNRPVAVLLNDGHGNFLRYDPDAFSSVIENSEAGWTFSTVEIKDSAAALLSRHLSGDCEGGSGFASLQPLAGLLIQRASRNSSFLAVVSFRGRAPPFLGLPV